MIQNNNKIKENKYKILRMSLLLGNGDGREETISNFEEAAREIDAMNDEIYLKDLQGKFYDTLTLEEEEKKLSVLVDYIGGRLDQRISLLEDFSNITGYELVNLPPIKYQDKLEEYKERLKYIKEYLDNNKNIEKYKREVDSLENELNNSYMSKAKSEERNNKSEEELSNRFNNITRRKEEFNDINSENIELKLSDIKAIVDDSKKSLDIFNKSYSTLNSAGISGEEKEEYLSYVNNAKEAYYSNKELEYLMNLYMIINTKETEYSRLLSKRDSINEIIYERISLRKELKILNEDILSSIYSLLEKQYDDISKQKETIDNIEYLNSEINKRKDLINDLEQDNKKTEIIALLKEFCIIEDHDEDIIEEDKKEDIESDNILDSTENNEEEENKELIDEKVEIPSEIIANPNNIPEEAPLADEIAEETPITEETPKNENIDYSNYEDNEVVSVTDASKINIEEAISKSNNVMKRVGEMLGVKIEKEENDTPKEEVAPEQEKITTSDEISKEETHTNEIPSEESNKEDASNEPANIDLDENIFLNTNFDADPEINNQTTPTKTVETLPENPLFNAIPEINEEKASESTNETPSVNPLFNNELANKTLDEVMESNQNIEDNNDTNDFWFSQEETPMDLNSLPDINTNTQNTNSFFNNNMPNIDFPSLEGQSTNVKEDATE